MRMVPTSPFLTQLEVFHNDLVELAKAKKRCQFRLPSRLMKNTTSLSRAVRHLSPLPTLSLLRGCPTGGTAGCVVASRLATADPDLRLLVLEAGPPTNDIPAHRYPAHLLSHIMPGSQTTRA